MPDILWVQPLKSKHLLLFLILLQYKTDIFGYCDLLLWEDVLSIFSIF